MQAWQAILGHPLFWVGVTLAAYQFGLALYQRTRLALFHPVLVSTPVLVLAIFWIPLFYVVVCSLFEKKKQPADNNEKEVLQ